ncbi:MAG: hypothetical protein WAV40_04350 [Microgenomates group bacterium]
MKILIFTEGTAIMPSISVGVSREERVKQSADNLPEVNDFRTYVPNGRVVEKLEGWKKQGAEIWYLTSRTEEKEVEDVRQVLIENKFPDVDHLLFRHDTQAYKDVAEQLMPDDFIEDDCESIGGELEMTYPHIDPAIRPKIHSIIVKEFAGIDNLPSDIAQL